MNHEYPSWIDSSTVVYLRTSYNDIPKFVVRSGDAEKKVRVRDVSADNYFSYTNGKIIYAAYKPDIRWGWRDYSELKILDVRTGLQRKLTHKTKYFSPDISADGGRVVAVDVDEGGHSALHLLRGSDGSLEKKLLNPEGLYFTYPKFYGSNKVVTAVRSQQGKMSMAIIDLTSNSITYILPFSWSVIGFPSVEKEAVYFTASFNGADKIFRWVNDQLYIVSESGQNTHNTGDYQLNALGDKLVWTRFTATGYQLMFGQNDKRGEKSFSAEEFLTSKSDFGVTSISDSLNQFLLNVPSTAYQVTKYSKSFRLFNFHSRQPYISDPDYSLAFVSENMLNTFQSEIYGAYNRNERFKQAGFSALYGGLFPVLRLGTHYTFDRNERFRIDAPRRYWNEWGTSAGISLPFNLSEGRSITYLTLTSDYVYNKRYFTGYYKDSFENRAFGYINASLNISHQIQKALQHIYPRLAQTVMLNYRRGVTRLEGNQFLASGNFYLPGLFANHSFVLQAAWQRKDALRQISFSNSFPFARGYSAFNFDRMLKLGVNYHFPLVYPDWGLANIIYFLRIRSNLFYDYSGIVHRTNTGTRLRLNYRSYGSEIFFDTRWWNQLPISFGFRYSRLIDPDIEGRGANQFEFILPVNLLRR